MKAVAIDTEHNGTYRADGWVYEVRLTREGTRSEGVVGLLTRNGAAIPEPEHVNDSIVTPWGRLFGVGPPNAS